jgi:uncharacterized protein YyaL (SSP411 family)
MNSTNEEGTEHNKLIFEKSPYLLQHAQNPVDWYPWGKEAFERAKRENKPIFLSIGYSTCHWCHVMAHESFEDEDVSILMNRVFVSVKVDREERPDIDSIYMTVCQLMTGSGGWPLSIIMTPDKRPFFAATYIPKASRSGMIGLKDLIPNIEGIWKNEREKIERITDEVIEALTKSTDRGTDDEVNSETHIKDAYEILQKSYDEEHGGFGSAPKFPTPSHLLFLLRYWNKYGEEEALKMVENTLSKMRSGGVYDHVGFGFHRYSTDRFWLVPHFEKMLYDQAFLSMAYTEAFQATGKKDYEKTVREIFSYVSREMTSPEGGFYSAEDADSEGEEGRFYLWTEDELEDLLSEEELSFCKTVFNLEKGGNYLDEALRHKNGKNILNIKISISELAVSMGITPNEIQKKIEGVRKKLYLRRKKRIHPHKDDKILTDWNGLMIAALARAYKVFNDKAFLSLALGATEFLFKNMINKDGKLLHRYREGESAIDGTLNDYVFLLWGLLDLYEATFNQEYLRRAFELNETIIKHFWDEKGSGFFITSDYGEQVLFRNKDVYDGALPSSNSIQLLNMLRLCRITSEQALIEKIENTIKNFSGTLNRYPAGYTFFLSALYFQFGPTFEIVIVGDKDKYDTKSMISVIYKGYFPNMVVLFKSIDEEAAFITEIAPFTEEHKSIKGKATAYVCKNFTCSKPTVSVAEMLNNMGGEF